MGAGFPEIAAVAIEQRRIGVEQEVGRGAILLIGIGEKARVCVAPAQRHPTRRTHEERIAPTPSAEQPPGSRVICNEPDGPAGNDGIESALLTAAIMRGSCLRPKARSSSAPLIIVGVERAGSQRPIIFARPA